METDESDMNHVAGEQCMDRLANKLGGQAVLPPTFQVAAPNDDLFSLER